MRYTEKICHKIKSCRIPFSPEAAIWIRRVQVYYSFLRYHKWRVKNRGNLKRAARQCNIPNPLSLSIAEIYNRLKECKKECVFFQEHRKRYHRKHLNNRLRAAQEKEDEEAIQKISAIIQREQKRSFWRRLLNYCTGKKKTRSATTVQVDAGRGAIVEHTTRERMSRRYSWRSITSASLWLGKPQYATAYCLTSLDTPQTHQPPGMSWGDRTLHVRGWIRLP